MRYDSTVVRLRVCPCQAEVTWNSTMPLAGSAVMSRTTACSASTSMPFRFAVCSGVLGLVACMIMSPFGCVQQNDGAMASIRRRCAGSSRSRVARKRGWVIPEPRIGPAIRALLLRDEGLTLGIGEDAAGGALERLPVERHLLTPAPRRGSHRWRGTPPPPRRSPLGYSSRRCSRPSGCRALRAAPLPSSDGAAGS